MVFYYEMDPLTRFGERARYYVTGRPSYASEAIDRMVSCFNLDGEIVVADIGAGTGISSRLLADRGLKVIAIEPNEEMISVADVHPLVEFQNATAESTGLVGSSVDLVSCFQSFHWFKPESSLLEFHRILKRSGWLSVVWNKRDQSDPFTNDYCQLVKTASDQDSVEEQIGWDDVLLGKSEYFSNVEHFMFCYRQNLDLNGLIHRVLSNSYVPLVDTESLIKEIEELFGKWSGDMCVVELVYNTHLYLAKPVF